MLTIHHFPIFTTILIALVWCNACARQGGEEETRYSNETREADLDLEAELFAQAFDEAKAKRDASAEPNDIDLTLELFNESVDEDAPQAPSGGDLGLGAPPLSDTSATAVGKAAPTGQSQMTDQEREEFARRVDALAAEVENTLAEVRTTQKALDREMEDAISNMFSSDGLSAAADVNRIPECVALTNAIIGGKTYQDIYDYLLGRAKLDLGLERRNPLRDCAMKKDGLAILVLVLDRIENDWVYGTPSPEWVMDALLTSGEFGAKPAGFLADLWAVNFGEKQYFENGLYWRLTNSDRMKRLRSLMSSTEGWGQDFDQMLADIGELKKTLNDTQTTCWRAQGNHRELPETGRADFVNIMNEVAPRQQEACALVGIDVLELGPLPQHKVQWAEGVEDLSFRSSDVLVSARDVARLFDNWRRARSKNNWNSEYASFVHFSDYSKTQYVAGYDPYPHRYGDTMHYGFRVLRVDFGVYREFLSAYWAPFSDPAYAREHPIEDAREDVKKILLAIEPGIHFLLGHYQEEGMWTWMTLEDALRHPKIYAQSKPFHEYEAMITDALK
jgi:hypothetical protein